ncbi:MAG: amidohydrolase family protein [Fimbriimonadaceae bacterium]
MTTIAEFYGAEGYGTYEVTWGAVPEFRRVAKPANNILVPGFIDIHLHGGWGIDFMSASREEMLKLCDLLEADGYEGFMATTVTASSQEVLGAMRRMPDHPAILGVHLEGPFISHKFPGAQPPGSIQEIPVRESDWDEVLTHPQLRVATMAPELPHALELTTKLSGRGVIVSMGHSNASYEEARRGLEFGAFHVTHMFNAMRPLHHREAGIVGYALSNDNVVCELIYDRLHVCFETAKLLLKVKPGDKVVAVSDSTAATRLMKDTEINMWGQDCIVSESGSVRIKSSDTLAGSTITLLDAFRNLHADFGPEVAVDLCSHNPRKALGMSGPPRTYTLLNKQLELECCFSTYGERVG